MANLGNKTANIGKRAYANKRKKEKSDRRARLVIYWPTFYCLQFVRNVDSEKREADTFSAFIIYLAPSFFYYYSLAFFLFTALLFSIPPFIGILSKVLYYHKIKLPGIYFPARNKVIIMPGWGFYPLFFPCARPLFYSMCYR